ncbi:hypothetical protein JXO59_16525 [candidate division KSB1 bacterium]|nr:hypothetical protein [candidate division KSB1 bacterium]
MGNDQIISEREIRTFSGHYIGDPREIYLRTGINPNIDIIDFGVNPDKKTFWSASEDGTIRLWDLSNGTEIKKIFIDSLAIFDKTGIIDFSSDGKYTLYEYAEKIYIIDLEREILTHTIEIDDLDQNIPAVNTVIFSPDGKSILCGCKKGPIYLVDVKTGKHIGYYGSRKELLTPFDAEFSQADKQIVARYDDRLRTWDGESNRTLRLFQIGNYPQSFTFMPDGKRLITGDCNSMTLQDVASGDTLKSLR